MTTLGTDVDHSRQLITAGVSGSGLFHGTYKDSFFKPVGYGKVPHYSEGVLFYNEDSRTVTNPNKVTFVITPDAHFIGDMRFVGVLQLFGDEIGVNGTTKKRFINNIGLHQIHEVKLSPNVTTRGEIKIPGEYLHVRYLIENELRDIERLDERLRGGLSSVDRDLEAAGNALVPFVVELKTPYSDDPRHLLPVSALRDDMLVTIEFKDDNELIEYDGVTVPQIVRSDFTLEVDSFSLFDDHVDFIHKPIHMDMQGHIRYQNDCIFHTSYYTDNDITSDMIDVKIEHMTNDVAAIFYLLRYTDEAEAPATNTGYDNMLTFSRFALYDRSTNISGWITKRMTEDTFHKMTDYPFGENILFKPYALNIKDRFNAYGSSNPSAYSDPRIKIELDPDVIIQMQGGRTLRIDEIYITQNLIQVKSGTGNMDNPQVSIKQVLVSN